MYTELIPTWTIFSSSVTALAVYNIGSAIKADICSEDPTFKDFLNAILIVILAVCNWIFLHGLTYNEPLSIDWKIFFYILLTAYCSLACYNIFSTPYYGKSSTGKEIFNIICMLIFSFLIAIIAIISFNV